jgi:diadenosine tetraphosphatase ApaH/serine/threonine PP2A family protein phosphatase
MKIAIITDIHANIEALTVVLDDIDARNITEIVCLGDLVGYNANPNECVEEIRARNIPCLMGNHDAVACGIEDPWGFNEVAQHAAMWTRRTLTDDNIEFLRETPPNQLVSGGFLGVHGSPQDRDLYLFSWAEVHEQFKYLDAFGVSSCFFGHTHFPGIFSEHEVCYVDETNGFTLDGTGRFFINPGSVGQPRDNDPRAAYVVFNTETMRVQFIRLEYDIPTAAEKIKSSGLRQFLADRLVLGR